MTTGRMTDQNLCSTNGEQLQSSIRDKFAHLNPQSLKWKSNVIKSMKHRRRIVSKALINANESLIEVNRFNHHIPRPIGGNKERIDDILIINVSGNRYETRLSTLELYPQTLLGDETKRKRYWNNQLNEYFFDRNRSCFEVILSYYQSEGRLRRPDYIPLDTFLEEVSFFQLGQHAIKEIHRLENVSFVQHLDLPNWFWRRYIWFYIECPQYSTIARMISLLSTLLTILSCLTLAVKTLPVYNQSLNETCRRPMNWTSPSFDVPVCPQLFSSPFFVIETICVSYFTIEFLLRLISTPSYWRFLLSLLNWIDLGAIIPFYVVIALAATEKEIDINGGALLGLRLLLSFRLLRLYKVHLIFKSFKSLRVLTATLKESFIDFIILIISLTLVAFLFGAATYFAEKSANSLIFDSIPKATYWGIITITTVGYGDMYPMTPIGRTLSCLCALVGIVIVGMLVSVLVDRYQRIYNRKKFSPEQILPVVDAADSEHDAKQDFIRKKLSGLKSHSSEGTFFSTNRFFPMQFENHIEENLSSSHIRFLVSFLDEKITTKSSMEMIEQLLKEFHQTIATSEEQIHLKLIAQPI